MSSIQVGGVASRRLSGAVINSRLLRKLLQSATTDFCPNANRYVYWLKEPIGWFLTALVVSVLVGLHVNPLGWTLAAVIGGIVVVGMLWPWIAVRAVTVSLRPLLDEVHEGETSELILSIRNSLPSPLWGLAIEGYLDRESDEVQPTTALACVPGLSHADYRLEVQPELRGRYPIVRPTIACAFPFGIWTARRVLDDCQTLTVLPQIHTIQDDGELGGGRMADWGDGLRPGSSGELLGVREFRGGDRLRNVHWVHTARTGNLMVCERSGPEQQCVELHVDVRSTACGNGGRNLSNREAIAWRIRAAASLITHLHARRFQIQLYLGSQSIVSGASQQSLRQMLIALADVPAEGLSDLAQGTSLPSNRSSLALSDERVTPCDGRVRMMITNSRDARWVEVALDRSGQFGQSRRQNQAKEITCIDLLSDIPAQMSRFWREVERARFAA